MVLVTSEQMQVFDKRTISTLRVPGIVLIDHAGKALATAVAARNPARVVVVCGKGNNGGDGWAAARWLIHLQVPSVRVISTHSLEDLHGGARLAAEAAVATGVDVQVYQTGALPEADVVVDSLLGTGADRPLTGRLLALVEAINAADSWVISADVPTGVHASTGQVPGAAVRADQTICMAAQKLGTAVTPGCLYAGEVSVADIGITLEPSASLAAWTTAEQVRMGLPPRDALTHKGTFGRLGIVVGEMPGAALLAGLGAARMGAGLVILGTVNGPLQGAPLEFVQRSWTMQPGARPPFADCDAVVVGPGLGRMDGDNADADAAVNAFADLLASFPGTGVVDADGLLLLRRNEALTRLPRDRFVLTPHPKECARLLGRTTQDVQANRLEAAQTLAQMTDSVVILKGFRSIVAHPDGRLRINPTGNAALATAGTGDVLAGIVGGLLAQGLDAFAAAALGAFIHGLAGERAGVRLTAASVLASDVVDAIAAAIRVVLDVTPGEHAVRF